MAHPIDGGAPPLAPPHGPGAPPGAPPPLALPRTYRELLANEANSPPPARLAEYLRGYRFDGAGDIPVPATLRDQTVTLSDRQPMAFLCCVTGIHGGVEVAIVHRLMRYMDIPGEEPSGYHNAVLGLLGDIMPHQYPAVSVPSTAFHLAGTPVRVPTNAGMVALLPAWEDPAESLGPFDEGHPETEVVRPRHIQVVPGYYASLLLHRRGVTPKLAFQELYGAIQARGEEETCRDIVVWLKSACTARGGVGANSAIPIVHHALYPVHLPEQVYGYLIGKVRGDLPALAGLDAASAEVTSTLAGALRALTGARGGTDGGATDRPRETKSVQDVYKETYGTLLRFCNVTQPTDVAPVWTRLSNCSKSEQQTIISQELQRVCMARGLSTALYTPVVTATLKQMVTGFQFVGHGADDLATGCQPFLVSYAGNASNVQALEVASLGNLLAQGEQSATLTDIRTLREKEKVKFPRDITEVTITLGRYAVMCQTLLQGVGPPNPFVEALWALFSGMQNAGPFITEKYWQVIVDTPRVAPVYFAGIIRCVQVEAYEYLHNVAVNVAASHEGVSIPDFRPLISNLKKGSFHCSSDWVQIPEEYMAQTRANAGTPGVVASARASSTVSTAASSSASTRTGVSSLTTDTRAAPAARVVNPAPDAEFSNITVRPGGTRPVLRDHRPPANDAGSEFCLAWWLRSGCFENCGRRSTHRAFASASERTRLLSFCREHIAAPAAASGNA